MLTVVESEIMPQVDLIAAVSDVLSEPVRRLIELNRPFAYQKLVTRGPGSEPSHRDLSKLSTSHVFKSNQYSVEAAQLVIAGLWLWHDWLDECHNIVQKVHGAEGSYWHAIMHRREGDFSNSKYWIHRTGGHPDIAGMTAAVASVDGVSAGEEWNPSRFVDQVEKIHNRSSDPQYANAVAIQQLEWQTLFVHCVRLS